MTSNGSNGNQPDLMTVQQVRKRLQVSDKTVRRIIHNGEIEIVRIRGAIRIHPEAIEKFIRRNTERMK